uniref:Uncharacterized protein n=1 Tax=Trichuris muris TaxID=70415 RepID=A0A5S6QL21_TRIMR
MHEADGIEIGNVAGRIKAQVQTGREVPIRLEPAIQYDHYCRSLMDIGKSAAIEWYSAVREVIVQKFRANPGAAHKSTLNSRLYKFMWRKGLRPSESAFDKILAEIAALWPPQ